MSGVGGSWGHVSMQFDAGGGGGREREQEDGGCERRKTWARTGDGRGSGSRETAQEPAIIPRREGVEVGVSLVRCRSAMESEVSSRIDDHDTFSFPVLDALTGQRVLLSLPCGCSVRELRRAFASSEVKSNAGEIIFLSVDHGENDVPPVELMDGRWLSQYDIPKNNKKIFAFDMSRIRRADDEGCQSELGRSTRSLFEAEGQPGLRSSWTMAGSNKDGECLEEAELLKELSLLSKQMVPVEQKIRARNQSATKLVDKMIEGFEIASVQQESINVLIWYLEELQSKDDLAGNRSRQSVDREERAKQLATFEACKEKIAKLETRPVDEGVVEWYRQSGRPRDVACGEYIKECEDFRAHSPRRSQMHVQDFGECEEELPSLKRSSLSLDFDDRIRIMYMTMKASRDLSTDKLGQLNHIASNIFQLNEATHGRVRRLSKLLTEGDSITKQEVENATCEAQSELGQMQAESKTIENLSVSITEGSVAFAFHFQQWIRLATSSLQHLVRAAFPRSEGMPLDQRIKDAVDFKSGVQILSEEVERAGEMYESLLAELKRRRLYLKACQEHAERVRKETEALAAREKDMRVQWSMRFESQQPLCDHIQEAFRALDQGEDTPAVSVSLKLNELDEKLLMLSSFDSKESDRGKSAWQEDGKGNKEEGLDFSYLSMSEIVEQEANEEKDGGRTGAQEVKPRALEEEMRSFMSSMETRINDLLAICLRIEHVQSSLALTFQQHSSSSSAAACAGKVGGAALPQALHVPSTPEPGEQEILDTPSHRSTAADRLISSQVDPDMLVRERQELYAVLVGLAESACLFSEETRQGGTKSPSILLFVSYPRLSLSFYLALILFVCSPTGRIEVLEKALRRAATYIKHLCTELDVLQAETTVLKRTGMSVSLPPLSPHLTLPLLLLSSSSPPEGLKCSEQKVRFSQLAITSACAMSASTICWGQRVCDGRRRRRKRSG
eukprot:760563-Hanusia_phi.AAC.3